VLDINKLKENYRVATYLKDYDTLWQSIAACLNSYINEYPIISGVYAGFNQAGVPSPLNLEPHQFHLIPSVSPDVLKAGATTGAAGINAALSLELSKTRIGQGLSGTITIVPATSPICPMVINIPFAPSDDYEQTIIKVCIEINRDIMASIPIPASVMTPAGAIASDGSIGSLTFTAIT